MSIRKYSLLENFKHTDSEIEDFFLDYVDKGSGFKITNGFLSSNNRFYTDIAGVSNGHKHCKRVEITLSDIASGIECHNSPQALTDITKMSNMIDEIKRFYSLSNEEVNFYISPKYDDIIIGFYVIGPVIDQSSISTKDEINSLLTELSNVIKLFNKKPILKTNWLEIRTNSSDENTWYVISKKIKNNEEFSIQKEGGRYDKLNLITKKIHEKGYKVKTTGGDRQVIFSLYK